MAASQETEGLCAILLQEFEEWQRRTGSEIIFFLEHSRNDDDSLTLSMLLGGEHEFKVLCPVGYPGHKDTFYVESDPAVSLWCNALNEFLLDSAEPVRFTKFLDRAEELHIRTPVKECMEQDENEEDDDSMNEDEGEENEDMIVSDDDSAFTTEWELKVARKKKRWALKEEEVREKMKRAKLVGACAVDLGAIQVSGQEKEQAKQIFTTTAASGILTNDLLRIMESEEELGFTADPVDDNIYQWCVKLYNFDSGSDLQNDLMQIKEKFGYSYIELEMDFTIDLYPFYPPLVKVIRPRLQGSMMQRVTNMEILKLSFWNPAKDMKNVLHDIKAFLQQWARLEVTSERNDSKRYPSGSYVEIEHHLLRLALVSEVNPRANLQYQLDVVKPASARPQSFQKDDDKKKKDEYWARGTGYGHGKRPEWDVKAYLAAQKEKDKQVESVLHKMLHELKVLYVNHAPQLKPRTRSKALQASVSNNSESVDPVEDMYTVLEGSALVPFIESYMKADSFLEICRHTSVYKVTVDIIREIALQPQLVRLLCPLPNQSTSVYALVEQLERRASTLLGHICRTGNGSIPKPAKLKVKKEKAGRKSPDSGVEDRHSNTSSDQAEEEKLAREFVSLYKDICAALTRNNLPEEVNNAQLKKTDLSVSTDLADKEAVLVTKYREVLHSLQFASHDMELTGANTHQYAELFKKMTNPNQSTIFRIAQELTSLSSSLPLNLSSSIFVRTDDDKLPLMRALITGPEGTPYSCGCFLFDIFFNQNYPKQAPQVNLQTTAGGSVRFNPNLYNCGKVCLSLLGTWEGQQGEQWNEITSTILQVLVSIQSLILVPEPYFNEPGYEQEIGTEAGKRHSNEYNLDVCLNSIKYAILAQIQSPSPGFEDVIHTHFYLKKDRLLEEADEWIKKFKSSKLERAVQNMKTELRKLQPPSNLANFFESQPDKGGGGDDATNK